MYKQLKLSERQFFNILTGSPSGWGNYLIFLNSYISPDRGLIYPVSILHQVLYVCQECFILKWLVFLNCIQAASVYTFSFVFFCHNGDGTQGLHRLGKCSIAELIPAVPTVLFNLVLFLWDAVTPYWGFVYARQILHH